LGHINTIVHPAYTFLELVVTESEVGEGMAVEIIPGPNHHTICEAWQGVQFMKQWIGRPTEQWPYLNHNILRKELKILLSFVSIKQ